MRVNYNTGISLRVIPRRRSSINIQPAEGSIGSGSVKRPW